MGWKTKLHDIYRAWFGWWWIDDPQPIALSSPYTFYLPNDDYLAAIRDGDLVKVIFRGKPISKRYDAERMWVTVTERDGDNLTGKLASEPFDMPQIKVGDLVSFKISHIIDINWNADELAKRNLKPNRDNHYWDRCYVDNCVLDDGIPVQYLYREEPDGTRDGDKYPDSGWRFRGHVGYMTDEQYENTDASYIAIGKVLNADDSWIHLIDSPVGSRFLKNNDTGAFEVVTGD